MTSNENLRAKIESLKAQVGPLIAKARAEQLEAKAYAERAREQVKNSQDAKKLGLEGVWSAQGLGGSKQTKDAGNGVTQELHGDGSQIQKNADGSAAVLLSGGVGVMLPVSVVEQANPENDSNGEQAGEPVVVQIAGEQVQLHSDISVWLQPKKQLQVHIRPNGVISAALPHARVQMDNASVEDRTVIVYLPDKLPGNDFPGFKVGLLPQQAVLVDIPQGAFGYGETGWAPKKAYVDQKGSFTIVAADGTVGELKPDGRLLVQQTLEALDDNSDVKKVMQRGLTKEPQPPKTERKVNKGKRCGGGFVLPPKPKPKPKPKKREKAKEMPTSGSRLWERIDRSVCLRTSSVICTFTPTTSGDYAKQLVSWLKRKRQEMQERRPEVRKQIDDARATFEKARQVWGHVQGIIDGGRTQSTRDRARECVLQMEALLKGEVNNSIKVQTSEDGKTTMYAFPDGTKLQRTKKRGSEDSSDSSDSSDQEVLLCMVEGGGMCQRVRTAGAREIVVLDPAVGEQVTWPAGSEGAGLQLVDGPGGGPAAVSWASPSGEQLQMLRTGVVIAMVRRIDTAAASAAEHFCTVQIDPRNEPEPMRVTVARSPQREDDASAVQLLAMRDDSKGNGGGGSESESVRSYGLVVGSDGKKEQISENGHFTVEEDFDSSSSSSSSSRGSSNNSSSSIGSSGSGASMDKDFPRMSLHKDDSVLVERTDGSQFHLMQNPERLLSLTELPGEKEKWNPINNNLSLDEAFPASASSPMKKLSDAKDLDSKINAR